MSISWRQIDTFKHSCRSGEHARPLHGYAGLARRQTASVYLKQLTDIGILREHKVGREKIFLNPAFIDLLKRD